jgi:transposase-like protein
MNIATARDISQMREALWISCLDCQHDASISTAALIERGLGDRPVSQFRFRCTKCGSVRANPRLDKWPISGPPPFSPIGRMT